MKILLIEDDPVHRSFLKEVVTSAIPECQQLWEATQGVEGEQLAREHQIPSVVMNLQMPQRTGIEAAKVIWRERPETAILFWSNYADEAYVRGISRIVPHDAAYGYILKTASEEHLQLALRSLFIEQQCVIDREVRGVQQQAQDRHFGLNDLEYEVLQDIALGLTDRMIAQRRNLSLRSVQNRLQQLYEKLHVHEHDHELAGNQMFNLRTRAVHIAMLRKLLNNTALQQAEVELAKWRQQRQATASQTTTLMQK